MNINPRSLIVPLVAAGVLVFTLQQTLGALRASGSWQARRTRHLIKDDPYTRIDDMLAQNRDPLTPDRIRNPFAFGAARAAVVSNPNPTPRPVVPPPAPKPFLTSIIFDQDPRATVRYDGREFSVRQNSLFADFTVKSITSQEVVLDRNGEQIVLTLRPKGD